MALGVWRTPAAVDVDRLSEVQDRRVCAVVEVVVALMVEGVVPSPAATPEEIGAARQVNAQLAERRGTIMGMDAVREMGC